MALTAICISTCLISCGDDDVTNTPNKKPIEDKVSIYAASISEAYFDLYDISVVFYHGTETKEIALKKVRER